MDWLKLPFTRTTLTALAAPTMLAVACGGEVGGKHREPGPSGTGKPDQVSDAGDTQQDAAPDSGMNREADATVPTSSPGDDTYGVCSPDEICWELPAPQGHTLHAVHAVASDDVWAVGELGTVLRFDGTGFIRHQVDSQASLRAVHAHGKDVWVVGDQGTVLHFDGDAWEKHDVDAIVDGSKGSHTGNLFGVFAASSDAVWIVGHSGVAGAVGFYDGDAWHDQSLGADTSRVLRAVWGAAQDDVWAVGDEGTVRHYDGTGWLRPTSPTGESLHAVHGAAANEVWMVGDEGTAIRWDGQRLAKAPDGIHGQFRAVVVDGMPTETTASDDGPGGGGDAAVGPPARVWVFGSEGRIFRYNDVGWTAFASGDRRSILGATGLAESELMAVGEGGLTQLYRAEERATLSYGSDRSFLSLFGMPSGELWNVGDEVLRARDNGWYVVESARSRSLFAAWGDADGVWAVGTAGTVLRFRDGEVEDLSPPGLAGAWLRSVWGAGGTVWVVGHAGVAARRNQAGDWIEMEVAAGTDLMDVWGLADDDMWIVGDGATALHWNGGSWSALPIGDAIGAEASLRSIWGPAPDNVWAVGSLGTIAHWNGAVWEDQSIEGTFTLNDVWGPSKDEIYAVGTGGTVLRFDGERWTPLASGTDRALQAVGPGPDGRVRVAGLDGTVLVVR